MVVRDGHWRTLRASLQSRARKGPAAQFDESWQEVCIKDGQWILRQGKALSCSPSKEQARDTKVGDFPQTDLLGRRRRTRMSVIPAEPCARTFHRSNRWSGGASS